MRVTNLGPSRRAAALVLHMSSTAAKYDNNDEATGDHLANNDEAERIANSLRNYFARETVTSISQEAARSLQLRRADRAVGGFAAEYDPLRRTAEFEMQMGAGSPEAFVPVMCTQKAALPS